jgi:hypothetical protein
VICRALKFASPNGLLFHHSSHSLLSRDGDRNVDDVFLRKAEEENTNVVYKLSRLKKWLSLFDSK